MLRATSGCSGRQGRPTHAENHPAWPTASRRTFCVTSRRPQRSPMPPNASLKLKVLQHEAIAAARTNEALYAQVNERAEALAQQAIDQITRMRRDRTGG